MTATASATGGTAASTGRLPSVASGIVEFVWPMYLTLVFTLGAWVLVPTVVLGWKPVTIISGSMAPAVQPGHVVVLEPYRSQSLGPGTVVTYRDADVDRLVTHRIVEVRDDGTMVTRGDANAVDDPVPLTADRIEGVGRLVVPAAGLPALWSHEGRTGLLAGLAALTALAAGAAAGAATGCARSVRHRVRAHWRRRDRRRARTAALTAAVVVVVGALGATRVGAAAFVGAEENPTNSFAAASVAAPTSLTASSTCQVLVLTLVPTVQLDWVGAGTFEIERSTSATSGFAQVASVTGTSFTDVSGLDWSTTYHYRVRAVAGSWASAPASASTKTPSLLC